MIITQRYNDHYPRLYVITLALKWLLGLVFLMTMASISSNDYSDRGALPSSSTSLTLRGSTVTGSQQITKEVSRKNGGNSSLLYPTLLHLVSAFV